MASVYFRCVPSLQVMPRSASSRSSKAELTVLRFLILDSGRPWMASLWSIILRSRFSRLSASL